jgi:16S rRNA (uracil1498-N3)-methyltransferase
MHRFYVNFTPVTGDTVALPSQVSRQIARVLRLRNDVEIGLFDGSGTEWLAVIESVERSSVSAHVGGESRPETEPGVQVTLSQSLIKLDRFELVLQKATELGVSRIQPIETKHTNVRPPSASRIQRWERIVQEAAEQSERVRLPVIEPVRRLGDALAQPFGEPLVFWEREASRTVRDALDGFSGEAINLFIGPEGGFTEGEIAELESAGARLAGFGPRVLRAETAGIAGLAIVMNELGQMTAPANRALRDQT